MNKKNLESTIMLNSKFQIPNSKFSRGIGLVEIIIYIALLGMVSIFVINSFIQIANTYQQARAEREVLSNGRLILETINKAIISSQEVYAPTSRFNDDAGQLSLITPVGATTEHITAFVDFWVDNGQLFMRQEGQGETALSAASVRINKFRMERIVQGLGREAVKITLRVDNAPSKFSASITLNSTSALRGNY